MMFISFMLCLCHFVIFIYFYVQLDFVVPSFKSLLGHIRVLRGQIEVTFHCECCTAAEWPWLVCQLGCLAIATRRSAACHAMRTAAMRSVEVCRSVSKCVEVCRSVSKCQGQEYRLCADGDGSGPLHEGTANTGRFGFGSGWLSMIK